MGLMLHSVRRPAGVWYVIVEPLPVYPSTPGSNDRTCTQLPIELYKAQFHPVDWRRNSKLDQSTWVWKSCLRNHLQDSCRGQAQIYDRAVGILILLIACIKFNGCHSVRNLQSILTTHPFRSAANRLVLSHAALQYPSAPELHDLGVSGKSTTADPIVSLSFISGLDVLIWSTPSLPRSQYLCWPLPRTALIAMVICGQLSHCMQCVVCKLSMDFQFPPIRICIVPHAWRSPSLSFSSFCIHIQMRKDVALSTFLSYFITKRFSLASCCNSFVSLRLLQYSDGTARHVLNLGYQSSYDCLRTGVTRFSLLFRRIPEGRRMWHWFISLSFVITM